MSKTLLMWAVLISLSITPDAIGQNISVTSHQAAEIESLVDRSALILEQRGKKAFEEFRKKGSPWRYGDVYLFVVDMRGIVLFNAALPNREGRDLLEERDANGNQFHKDFVHVVKKFGFGWVDYMFPKPNQSVPTVKWAYVCGTTIDGIPAIVGAGVYVD